MARPKSEQKRTALLAAATRIIAESGLGAPTARIAKEAGVGDGTLFKYFETKDDLLCTLYIELKTELHEIIITSLPTGGDLKSKVFHLWCQFVNWGLENSDKRKTIAIFELSDRIPESVKKRGWETFADVVAIVEAWSSEGALRDQPIAFASAIMESMASTTMDFMISDPQGAEGYRRAGFEAFWNALAKPQTAA